jgi:hypothetical protein
MRRAPSFPFRTGLLLGIAAIAIIGGYTLYAALPYLLGPALSVTAHTENSLTTIVGKTDRVSYLSIDGGAVPLAEDGSFSAVRAFPPGYTAITISVKDRFGRVLTKTITFINQ